VIMARNLHPADLNGKADPYLVVKFGSKTISDVEHYVPKQLSPTFGRLVLCVDSDSIKFISPVSCLSGLPFHSLMIVSRSMTPPPFIYYLWRS